MDEIIDEDKYVVFKREELNELFRRGPEDLGAALDQIVLRDAVVIRTQDIFAGPTLWVYAHVLALAARTQTERAIGRRLQGIADYFARRAEEADSTRGKIPD